MSITAMTTTLAHAGAHDLTTGDGVLHALTAPDHLLATAACVFTVYVAYGIYRRLSSPKARIVANQPPSPTGKGQR